MALDPASLPDDVAALKRMIIGMAQDAVQANTLIEKLRFELARLKRSQFGASSEKLSSRIEQLELAIEALEIEEAERLAAAPVVAEAVEAASPKPARRPLPDHPGLRRGRLCRARRSCIPAPVLARPAAVACAGSART